MKIKKSSIHHLLKKNWLISLFISLFFSISIYLLFLQHPYVISKLRLAITMGIWIIFAIFVSLFLNKDPLKLQSLKFTTIVLALCIGFVFSLVFISITFPINQLPLNLLLLPQKTLEIQVICNNNLNQPVELKYFHNGLAIVSYASFNTKGSWVRTQDSYKTEECDNTSLIYKGWLIESPYIAFRTQPNGGRIALIWNNTRTEIDLNAPEIGELKFTQYFGIAPINRISGLVIFSISLSILLLPITVMLAKDVLSTSKLTDLERWFNETSAHIFKLIQILLIFSFISTILLFVSPYLTKDTSYHSSPNLESKGLPNIIIIIADALGAEDMSIYGYPLLTTPKLAEETKDWTIYTNANTPATCTIAVYPALISGKYPYFSYPFSRYGQQIVSSSAWVDLTQILFENGYTVWWQNYNKSPGFYHLGYGIDQMLFSPNNNPLMRTWFQYDLVRSNRFPFFPYLFNKIGLHLQQGAFNESPSRLGDMFVNGEIRQPFYIYMHYRGVHPGSYYSGKYLGAFLPVEQGMVDYYSQFALLGAYTPDKQSLVDKLRLRYDEAILNEDEALSQFIDTIKQAGLYDSSMIIITGDHGQVFNNGYTSHCTPLLSYAETHVPLLVKYPYQTEGKRVDSLISLIDITPTILDVVDIPYQENDFDGASLMDIESSSLVHPYVFVRSDFRRHNENESCVAVLNNQYKLNRRGKEYFLYDYINDPNEKNNLIQTLNDSKFVESLMQFLNDFLEKTN